VVRPADLRMTFTEFMKFMYSDVNASFYLEYCSINSHLPEMAVDIKEFEWANFLKKRTAKHLAW